jgi:hypothetical protein
MFKSAKARNILKTTALVLGGFGVVGTGAIAFHYFKV